MSDYIKREDALKVSLNDSEIYIAINSIPSADVVERKKGKWELQEDLLTWEGTFDGYFCSECGRGYLNDLCCGNGDHYVDVTKEFNFCPNCGADMQKEEVDDL